MRHSSASNAQTFMPFPGPWGCLSPFPCAGCSGTYILSDCPPGSKQQLLSPPLSLPVTSVGSLPFSSRPHSAGLASCSLHLCLCDTSTPSHGYLQCLNENIILSLTQLA